MGSCLKPDTYNGHEVACRWCDKCVSNRIGGWTARCLMERAVARHTLSLCLSYDDDTEHNRRSARMFDYTDVSLWLMRLRRHFEYHNLAPRLRFAAAGEQGSRFGRVHWHVIICTDTDLRTVGEWLRPSGNGGKVKVRAAFDDIVTYGLSEKAKRRNWSMWPHGFTTAQVPDYDGIRYAISYALKDAFTPEKAKGSARETKVEALTAGLFRPSKFPPLGTEFIERKIEQFRRLGAVLPHTKLLVPGRDKLFDVQIEPLRSQLLRGFRSINEEVRERTGQDCAAWPVLIRNLRESETALGVLYGRENEAEKISKRSAKDGNSYAAAVWRRVKRCGSTDPCNACLRVRSSGELASVGIQAQGVGFRYSDPDAGSLEAGQADCARGGPHPWCVFGETKASIGAFASYATFRTATVEHQVELERQRRREADCFEKNAGNGDGEGL